jgi:hypothetical protein
MWIYVGANIPLVTAVFLLSRYHVYLWGPLGLGATAAVVAGVMRNRPPTVRRGSQHPGVAAPPLNGSSLVRQRAS